MRGWQLVWTRGAHADKEGEVLVRVMLCLQRGAAGGRGGRWEAT